MISKPALLIFLQRHNIGVISTVSSDNLPEAAVIEVVVNDQFEIIFDTFTTSKKYANLMQNPHVAFVIGWDENITVQYEGVATELKGDELAAYQKTYFVALPDATSWTAYPELTYFKVVPTWMRYRDGENFFSSDEFTF